MSSLPVSDAFPSALNFVLDALKTRRDAGALLKASSVSLENLQAAIPAQHCSPSLLKKELKSEGSVGKAERPVEFSKPSVPKNVQAEVPVTRAVPLVSSGDKIAQLSALRAQAAACVLCPNLVLSRSSVVFGEGNPDAELMLVGEAPGVDEDMQGKPFVGEAGQLLEKMLQAMGLFRDQVYIANVLKCRPDQSPGATGNRKPTKDEMGRCLPYLQNQIALVRPKVIVALGASAMQGLFGRTEPMARLRSQWYTFLDIPVMATFHPSYLIHNQAMAERRKVWEDLLQVMERLEHPISQKQRGFFAKAAG